MTKNKDLSTAESWLTGLLYMALVGILFLVVFGNLSGNLGFARDTNSFANETIVLNATGNSPAGLSTLINPILSSSGMVVTNATSGAIVPTTNYTVSANKVLSVGSSIYVGTNVNVSYSATSDGVNIRNSDAVIGNATGGVLTFFSFSNTFFNLVAVTLLIVIILGVIRRFRGSSGGGNFN